MINITLPDGSKRPFEQPVTVQEVAASIGAGLAKAALAGKVDGKLVDTGFRIERDAELPSSPKKVPRRSTSSVTRRRTCSRRRRSGCFQIPR